MSCVSTVGYIMWCTICYTFRLRKGQSLGLEGGLGLNSEDRECSLGISRSASRRGGAREGWSLEVRVRRDARHRGAQVGSSSAPGGVRRATGGRAFGTFLVPRTGEGARGGTHSLSRRACARALSS